MLLVQDKLTTIYLSNINSFGRIESYHRSISTNSHRDELELNSSIWILWYALSAWRIHDSKKKKKQDSERSARRSSAGSALVHGLSSRRYGARPVQVYARILRFQQASQSDIVVWSRYIPGSTVLGFLRWRRPRRRPSLSFELHWSEGRHREANTGPHPVPSTNPLVVRWYHRRETQSWLYEFKTVQNVSIRPNVEHVFTGGRQRGVVVGCGTI